MNVGYTWYATLIKPSWAPPSWLFGPVWTILYILIIISFGYVFFKTYKKQVTFKIATPFILNLFFNFIFTPIQFGLKNNYLAAIDIFLVLVTLFWALKTAYTHFKWVTYVNIPYFAWVLFATILQFTVTYLNR